MTVMSPVLCLAKAVKPKGFLRLGNTFNRQSGQYVDVVQLQKSGGSLGSLTLNAGVLDRRVHKLCWRDELAARVDEVECTVRTRAGNLETEKDLWWDASDEGLCDQVTHYALDQLIPFIDALHDPKAMAQFMQQNPRLLLGDGFMYLAVLERLYGNLDGVAQALEYMRKRFPGWDEKANEALARIEPATGS